LRLIVHGKTDKGLVRKENEDAFCIEKDLGLLAIADGMGGMPTDFRTEISFRWQELK